MLTLLPLLLGLSSGMVPVGPGVLPYFYPEPDGTKEAKIEPFQLDVVPVTNAEFLEFVKAHPEWQRGTAPTPFADIHYLEQWQEPLNLGREALPMQPATNVSWFAANAYCAAQGKRLPSENEWEFVAMASGKGADGRQDKQWQQKILSWYAVPNPKSLPSVGKTAANFWKVRDLHGLVWEWVGDFNSSMIDADNRNQDPKEQARFCGAGSNNAADKEQYASFMRFAFRSSLRAESTTANLGFRCAAGNLPTSDAGNSTNETHASFYNFRALFKNQNKQPTTFDHFRGSPVFVAMFYASCAGVCPMLIQNLKSFEARLSRAERKAARYLLVSLDPEVDTPEVLTKLVEAHKIDGDQWEFVTGSAESSRNVAALLNIRYRKLKSGSFNHTAAIVLLNERGELVERYDGMRPVPESAATDLKRLLKK